MSALTLEAEAAQEKNMSYLVRCEGAATFCGKSQASLPSWPEHRREEIVPSPNVPGRLVHALTFWDVVRLCYGFKRETLQSALNVSNHRGRSTVF